MNKETRQLVKALKKQGIKVDLSGRHPVAYRANRPGVRVTFASTGSDRRGFQNAVAQLRKDLGFKWKGR